MTDNSENINQIAMYETEDGKVKVDVRFEHENLWLTLGPRHCFFSKLAVTFTVRTTVA